jgi:hypothetical protein
MFVLALILISVAGPQNATAATPNPAAAIVGTWSGTSICVKIASNAACHDEQVIYKFTALPNERDRVTLHADKIENGRRLPMGDLVLEYDAKRNRWEGAFHGRRVSAFWSYKVQKNELTGTCVVLPERTVVRHASLHRD